MSFDADPTTGVAVYDSAGPTNGPCPDTCSATTGYDFVTGLGSPRAGVDAMLAATP